ncbi:MAG: hypothetical protein AAFZ52_05540 [Bacteroidota bacterium]
MIQEATIERVLDRLESGTDDFALEMQDFAHAQPELMTYLTDEDNEAFTEAERELLLFGALVIYQSVTDERTEPQGIAGTAIGKAEEANYTLMGQTKGSFRDRVTPFFAQSPEEELLAFIEDLLVAEAEDDSITKEAREPLFITLKTLVDVLTA